MTFIIICSIVFVIFVLLFIYAIKSKNKDKNELLADSRLTNAKYFLENSMSPIAVSENGNLGYIPATYPRTIKVFNIKDINSFELITDSKKKANIGGALVGGLLFGGAGAIIGGLGGQKEEIKKMTLLFRMNDFNNPLIEIPLMIPLGAHSAELINNDLKSFMATLEYLEKKLKTNNPSNE